MTLLPDPTPASGLASGRPLTAMPGSLRGLLATSAARAAESRAAMLHACARRGSGTRLRLLPRAVLMGVGPNSTPSSAQVTAKPQSSCAIVASEALASPRPPPRGHERSRQGSACAPSVALGHGFLGAAAFSVYVSGTDTDSHKRPCSGSTVHSSAVSVVPSDLCIMSIMRDQQCEI